MSKMPVAVDYGPQLVSGTAIFLAFQLGVTDIYSKTLPTIALQKTTLRKTTVGGPPRTHLAQRTSSAPAGASDLAVRPCAVATEHIFSSQVACASCRHDERHRRPTELEPEGKLSAGLTTLNFGRLGTDQRPGEAILLRGHFPLLECAASLEPCACV